MNAEYFAKTLEHYLRSLVDNAGIDSSDVYAELSEMTSDIIDAFAQMEKRITALEKLTEHLQPDYLERKEYEAVSPSASKMLHIPDEQPQPDAPAKSPAFKIGDGVRLINVELPEEYGLKHKLGVVTDVSWIKSQSDYLYEIQFNIGAVSLRTASFYGKDLERLIVNVTPTMPAPKLTKAQRIALTALSSAIENKDHMTFGGFVRFWEYSRANHLEIYVSTLKKLTQLKLIENDGTGHWNARITDLGRAALKAAK